MANVKKNAGRKSAKKTKSKEMKPPHKSAKLTARVMDKVKVKAGRLIRVWNQKKKPGANPDYVAVWIEQANGGKEQCLLLTQSQIDVATKRAKENKEDLTKKDFWTDLND